MLEIGGYLGLEKLIHHEYYPELIAVNTGRNALLYLLKAKNIKKLYIPYFLCDSVSGICERYQYEYECYHITSDFLPIFDKELGKNEYLYIVNFYGQISNEKIMQLKSKYENIIVDNVQAFFQKPLPFIDTLYSCRKFFGVPDGAYISTMSELMEELPIDVSQERMKHILGRFEGIASEYYNAFQMNDRLFESLELRQMSLLTHNILGAIDYEEVRNKRNENYAVLEKIFDRRNKLKLHTPQGPYAYPLYCEKGLGLRKKLVQNNIYIATLWPNVLENNEGLEKDYAENILPLPCDQRYSVKDMEYMASLILELL